MGLLLQTWSEKIMEWKHPDSLVKKTFWAKWLEKKIVVIVFWDMKKLFTTDFFEKGATVNSASYCQILR